MEAKFKHEITFIYYFSLLGNHIADWKPKLNSRVH